MSVAPVVSVGDPRDPAATALLRASHALMLELFEPESNHFLSVDALCVPEISFFVADIDGRTVGCGALARRDDYGEVKSMFVDPAARGAGVGAAIMARIETEARLAGLPWLKLETGNLLHEAHRLYARCGFAVCGPFGDYPEHPQSVFMEKWLG